MKLFNKTSREKNGESYLNKYFVPYLPLILLIIIVGVISYYRLLIQMDVGPLSDTCDFLLNALYFSGQGVGYYDWTRPVFFPLLIAIVFKLGFVSATAAYVVDLLIYIFGLIGFYLLLNLHFNKIESFFGGLLFATFPNIILLSGLGFSDFTCGTFLIWAIYFLVLAVKKNSKFFILFFLFWTMAFLTRYNAALIIFPVLFYLYMNKQEIKSYKYIAGGILASFLLIIPVLWFYQMQFGNILHPFITTFGATSTTFSPEYHPYNPDPLFYVDRFFIFTGFQSLIITLLIAIGLVVYTIIRAKNQPDIKNKLRNIVNIEKGNLKFKLIILFDVLTFIFILTFGQVHYMVSEIIFLAVGLVFFTLIKEFNIKNIDLHLLVFSWFMAFFIFNSVYVIKSSRYFILMAPGVAYLLLLGLRIVFSKLTVKLKKGNLVFPTFALFLTILILSSTASLLPSIYEGFQGDKITNEKIALASEWFTTYEPDYKNKVIYSDLWPYLAWHLKTDVKIMFTFKNNQAYLGGVKNNTFTPQDSLAFNNYLVDNNADYYFSSNNLNLTSYKQIKQFGSLIIYERI